MSATTAKAAPAPRILIVEDERDIAALVAYHLTKEGYQVRTVAGGAEALDTVSEERPDLVVLDVMLPGYSGLDVLREIRRRPDLADLPVVMLTARREEIDRIKGLELGADDYVTKPFSPRELALRVRSVLRRARGSLAPAPPARPLRDGDLLVDVQAHEATVGGEPLALTAREFDLLVFLLRHPRQAFTRDELLDRVWGWSFGDSSTVTVHVRRLREKIERDPAAPRRLVTVWGVGYRYEPADGGEEA